MAGFLSSSLSFRPPPHLTSSLSPYHQKIKNTTSLQGPVASVAFREFSLLRCLDPATIAAAAGDEEGDEDDDEDHDDGTTTVPRPRALSHPARAPVIVRGLVVTLRGGDEDEKKRSSSSVSALQQPAAAAPRRSNNNRNSSFFGAGSGAAAAKRAILAAVARPALAAAATVLPRFPVRVLDAKVEHAPSGAVVNLAGVELEFRSKKKKRSSRSSSSRGENGGESAAAALYATLALSPIEASVAALSSAAATATSAARVRVASMEASTLEVSVSAGGGGWGGREEAAATAAAKAAEASSSTSEATKSSPPRSPTRRAVFGHRRRHSTVDDDVALGRRHLHQQQLEQLSEGDESFGYSFSEPQPLLRATRLALSLGALDFSATAEAAAVLARLCAVIAATAPKEEEKTEEEKRSKGAPSASSPPFSLPDLVPLLPDSVLLALPRVSFSAVSAASSSSLSASARASVGPLRLAAGRRRGAAAAPAAAAAAAPFLYRASFELGGASVRVSSSSSDSPSSSSSSKADAVDARFGGCGASAVLRRGGGEAATTTAAAASSASSSSSSPRPPSIFLETTAKLGGISASVCPAAAWPLFASAVSAVERFAAADAATRAATERLEEEAEREEEWEDERATTAAMAEAAAPSSSRPPPPPPPPPPPISSRRRPLLLWSFELDRKEYRDLPFAFVSLLAADGEAAAVSLFSVEARGGSSGSFGGESSSSSSHPSNSGIRFSARGLEVRLGLGCGDLPAPLPAPAPALLSVAEVEAFLHVCSSSTISSSAAAAAAASSSSSPSSCPGQTGCRCPACCRCSVAATGVRLFVDESAVAALAAAVASAAPPLSSGSASSLLPPALSRLMSAAARAAAALRRKKAEMKTTMQPLLKKALPSSSGISLEVTDVEAVIDAPRGYDDASAVAVVPVRAGVGGSGEGKDDENVKTSSSSSASSWPYGKRPPVASVRSASATLRLERLAASGLGARGGGGGSKAFATGGGADVAAAASRSTSFEASAFTLVYRESLTSEAGAATEPTARSVDLLSVASARISLGEGGGGSGASNAGDSDGKSLSVAVSGVSAVADAGSLLAASAACRGAAAAAARALTEHCRCTAPNDGGVAAASSAALLPPGDEETGDGRRKSKKPSSPVAVALSFSDVAVSAALGDGGEWKARLPSAAVRLPPPPTPPPPSPAAAAFASPSALVVAEVEASGLGVDLDGEELLGLEEAAVCVAKRSRGGRRDDEGASAADNADDESASSSSLPPWAFSGAEGPRKRAEAAARASKGLEQDLLLSSSTSSSSPGGSSSRNSESSLVSVLAVRARGLACRLPHGTEFGRAQRHCELWVKAFTDSALAPALQETRAALAGLAAAARDGLGVDLVAGMSKKTKKKNGKPAKASPPPPLIEVSLSLDGASLDFEHHPFEAELARTLPAGADTAARAALWSRALEGAVGSASKGGSGGVSNAAVAAAVAGIVRQDDGGGATSGAASPTRGGGGNPTSSSNLSTLLSPASSFTASTSPENLAGPLAAAATRASNSGGASGGSAAVGTAAEAAATDNTNASASTTTTGPRTAVAASLAAAHIAKARAAASDPRGVRRAGAALRVEVDSISMLLLVAPKTAAATRRACEFASLVDPPTRGVALAGVVSLGVDADLQGARCFFCCCPAPLARVSSLRVSGPCIVARQQVAGEPAPDQRHVPLGQGRGTLLHCAAKGSKASPKAWVDFALRARNAVALFGGGLDPTIVMIAMAGKRLGPSDPDPTRPKLGNLPWWDMLRLNLRGSVFFEIERFRFDLSASSSPAVCGRSERMRASASLVSLNSTFGKFGYFEFRDLALEALGGPPPPPLPAAAVSKCKLAFIPEASAKVRFGWILPQGRSPEDHHLWPVVREGGEGGKGKSGIVGEGILPGSPLVAPVDPSVVYSAAAIDSAIEFEMRPRGSSSSSSASSSSDSSCSSDNCSSLRPRRPTVWMGGRQVGFTKRLVDALKSPPVWQRLVGRRGTWFSPQDPSRPPGANLPKLLRAMELDISAVKLVVEYDPPTGSPAALAVAAPAPPASDASSSAAAAATAATLQPAPIHLVSGTARYRGSLRLNVPLAPRAEELLGSLSAIARKRELSRTDTLTLLTDVVGEGLKLEAPALFLSHRNSSSSLGAGAPPVGTPIVAMPRLTVRGGRAIPRGLTAAEDPSVLAAAAALPTSVAFERARVCGGGDERDAVLELVQDLVASFKAPGRPKPPAAVAADVARRRARVAAVPSTKSGAAAVGGGIGDAVSAAAAAASSSVDITSSLMFASPPAAPSSPVKGAAAHAPSASASFSAAAGAAAGSAAPDGGELLKLLLAQQQQQKKKKRSDGEGGGGAGDSSEAPATAAAAAAPSLPPPKPASSLRASTTGRLPGSSSASSAAGAGVPLPARPPSYEIFADGIQVCAAASQAPGRVLVRAATARLSGGPPAAAAAASSRDPSRSALVFEAEGVAAFVALQDVDPRGTVVWLDDEGRVPDNGGGGLVAGGGVAKGTTMSTAISTTTLAFAAGTAPVLIVEPFAFSVRRASASEEASSSSSHGVPSVQVRPAAPPRPEELAVEMPAVRARAGAAEFAVIVDVGQTMGGGGGTSGRGGAPVPSAHSDAALLLSGGSTEGVQVAQAQRRYWAAAQELRSLRGDVAAAAPPATEVDSDGEETTTPSSLSSSSRAVLRRCPISSNSSSSRLLSPHPRAFDAWTSAAMGETAAADAAQALRDHLEETMVSVSASFSSSSSMAAPLAAGFAALEARLQAAAAAAIAAAEARETAKAAVAAGAEAAPVALALWGAAACRSRSAALEASRSRLATARAAARAAAPARHASFSRVALAGAAWRLLEPDGQPFLDADLGESVLASESHPDGSGASKLVLRRLQVSDPRRRLKGSPAPGVDVPGGVVVPWNPDESWREDPAARVVARRAPTAAGFAAVYEHVEATLHPLGVHLSDSLATGLWEYFFPPQGAAAGEAEGEAAEAEAVSATGAPGAAAGGAAATANSFSRTRRQERFARAIVGTVGIGSSAAASSAVGRVPSRNRLGGGGGDGGVEGESGGGVASPRVLSGDEADAEAEEKPSSALPLSPLAASAAASALANAAANAFGRRSGAAAAGRRRDGGVGAAAGAGERALSPLGAAAESASAAAAANAASPGEGLVSASVVGLPPRSPSPTATAQASAAAPARIARPRKVKSLLFSLS